MASGRGRRGPQGAKPARVSQKELHRIRERTRIARGGDDSGYAALDLLGNTADARRDNGSSAGQGFKDDVGEVVLSGSVKEQIRCLVVARQVALL